MRYRTKPVEVEAYEFTGTIASAEQLAARFPQAAFIGKNGVGDYDGRMVVQTANGPTNLHAGDFVVVAKEGGSISIMGADAFNTQYERVVKPNSALGLPGTSDEGKIVTEDTPFPRV